MAVKAVGQVSTNGEISEAGMISQYKEMIRDLDRKITEGEETVGRLSEEKNQLQAIVELLNKENALLKAMSQV